MEPALQCRREVRPLPAANVTADSQCSHVREAFRPARGYRFAGLKPCPTSAVGRHHNRALNPVVSVTRHPQERRTRAAACEGWLLLALAPAFPSDARHVSEAMHDGGEQRLEHRIVRIGEPVVHPEPFLPIEHETRPPQVGQVSRRARLRNPERLVDVAHAHLAAGEQRQNPEPRPVGHRLEQLLQRPQTGSLRLPHPLDFHIRLDKYSTRADSVCV